MNKFSDGISKWGGADAINKAARVNGAVQVGHMLKTALRGNFEQLPQAFKDALLKNGLGKKEFDLMKTMEWVKDPRTGQDLLPNIHAVLSDDFIVKSIRGANETGSQARARLRNSLVAFMEDTTSELIPEGTLLGYNRSR